MKKVGLIMQAKETQAAIKSLRSLGVVHVEYTQVPKNKDINRIHDELSLINQALEILLKTEFSCGCEGSFNQSAIGAKRNLALEEQISFDKETTAKHIIDTWKRIDHLQEFSKYLYSKIKEWEPWGRFDPETIKVLTKKNIYLRLFQVPIKELKIFPLDTHVNVIFTKGNIASCAVLSNRKFETAFKEVELPKMGILQMQERITEDWRIIESLNDNLRTFFPYQVKFLDIKKSLGKELEFQEVLSTMTQAKVLTYLCGFIPFDSQKELISLAKKQGWGILITEPAEDEAVPTLIRNPKWISIITPIFRLLEITPGYKELDISLLFLIFFSLFFGILIGDAGYGTAYLLITFLAHKKLGKKYPGASKDFFLFYILSFCAIIWGILIGSFFGQEWLAKTGFKPLIPALNNAKNIQAFCFFIGALHLTIAHSWRAILKLPSLAALADIGWVFVLWTAFFFAKLLILSDSLPFYGQWFLIAGVILVVFFTNPQKNILKSVGAGLGNLALNLMNNFTDVVSYVRLFAVGLASVAIADTFNNMASSIGNGNILAILASIFIVVAGHGLNLILGPMSVLVHGIRLNVLEFSGHAGVTWSGIAYKPFKE
ncbi:MAG: hypothetical protein QMD94_02040 [Candidatus Omnitrophota bacterium]|nr:hypothetical protein [Candidatus Omnitrophota bacterium]